MKIAAIVVGLFVAALAYLSYKGLLDVKWVVMESPKTLAASRRAIIDEIAFCPKDLYEKRRPSKKKTYAVCELCGHAYCSTHISYMNDAYYCEKHTYRSNTKQASINHHQQSTKINLQTHDMELSLLNIKNSLDYSIDKALDRRL